MITFPKVITCIVCVVMGGYFVRAFFGAIEPIGNFCDPHDWEDKDET